MLLFRSIDILSVRAGVDHAEREFTFTRTDRMSMLRYHYGQLLIKLHHIE